MKNESTPMRVVLLAGLLGLLAAAPARGGDLYRYVDARGVVHITDRKPDGPHEVVARPRGLRRSAPEAPTRYDPLITRVAGSYGVPAALVKAVIHAESAFNEAAVSRKGAMGLMQLMPETARELGVEYPFRAEENVLAGTRYLRRLHDRYGSWTTTLAAYNAGPSAVDRYRGIPPYAETRAYVDRVLSYYRRYHGDFSR
jgi:soluble lytic murein transglycosylase